jgi:ferredoxin
MLKIRIDEDCCVGSGQCARNAPEVFGQDDVDGYVILLDPEPPESLHEAAREAAVLCPTEAIEIIEEP